MGCPRKFCQFLLYVWPFFLTNFYYFDYFTSLFIEQPPEMLDFNKNLPLERLVSIFFPGTPENFFVDYSISTFMIFHEVIYVFWLESHMFLQVFLQKVPGQVHTTG